MRAVWDRMLSLELLLILFCMLAGAFFSGIETGVISIHRLRLHHLVRRGSREARIIEGFLRAPDRLLGTTLVGTNLSVVVVSTLTASAAVRIFGEGARSVSAAVVGLVVLVLCEYLPKAWFHSRPIEHCLPLARLLQAAERVLKPLGWLIIFLTRWLSPGKNGKLVRRSPFVTREHLQHLAHDSEKGGQISAFERLMIDRVLDLQLRTARQIMTPLARFVSVSRGDTLTRFFELVRVHGYARMPVRENETGAFVGVISFFQAMCRGLDADHTEVATCMRPPMFVSADMRADDILPLLRRHRQPLALVQDEKQTVIGLVTTEDILDEIVGRIPVDTSSERRHRSG